MKASLRLLNALFDHGPHFQRQLIMSKVKADDHLEVFDTDYSTTIMRGDTPVAAVYKRSKEVALEQAEQDHMQRMRDADDERPDSQ